MKILRKYRLEIILFIINAIYMILELVASRVLAPYFGTSNLIWTSVIGIILLSTSVGNYIGGIIADKANKKEKVLNFDVEIILLISGLLILLIPFIQRSFLEAIVKIVYDIKIGAIISTIILFFLPSMFIGMITPVILKLKLQELENVGKTAGKTSALATLGSIVGTFLGGFLLIPSFGSTQIIFVLAGLTFTLTFFMEEKDNLINTITIVSIVCIIISITCFFMYIKVNEKKALRVLEGKTKVYTNIDTQYGKVTISNAYKENDLCRRLNIDRGNESATFVSEDKCYELVYDYTKYYDLMFNSNIDIKETLMIGGAGYSYPKYYISHYDNKNMDVVEIDGKVTEIAKKYFYLDKLIKEYDLENSKRLNLITEDGRIFLNSNQKKYDAILNDAFAGNSPAKTLTTIEAVKKIHNSLNKNGIYLTNIISSIDGENSKFIKAEIKTLKQCFKNVYVVPCRDKNDIYETQNNMVSATDGDLIFENTVEIESKNSIVLTDDYCPVDTMIPKI